MTARIFGYAALNAYGWQTSAVSSEALAIREKASAIVGSAEESRTLFEQKATAISALRALARESAEQAGQGDVAIHPSTLDNAERFVRALPDSLRMPEFSLEPDGAISFDWIRSRHRMFSVSIGTSTRLAYAWLDGSNRGHAIANFDGASVAPDILSRIEATVGIEDASVRAA